MQERRTPVVPLMSEKEMIQLITSVLPAGEEHAIQLGSGAFEAVQVEMHLRDFVHTSLIHTLILRLHWPFIFMA